MSKLEELLRNLCPNGVPYRRLDECCTLEKGKTPIQKAVPGKYPLVVTTEVRKSANNFQFEQPTVCVPLVSSRGHGVACLNAVYYQEGKFALGNILCGVTPFWNAGLTAKFLYYYLNLEKDKLIVPLMKGGANVSLTVNSLKTVKVPIPPIEVQEEIIRLIDTFNKLISTMRAELTVRKKQYAYYKDKLLICSNSREYRIDELCDICRGRVMSKPYIAEHMGDYPVYSSQTENNGELGKIDTYDFDGEFLSWTTDGANAGTVFYRTGKFSVTNVCGLLKCTNDVVIPRFLFYALGIEAPLYVSRGMGNPKLMSNVMARIKVKIPSLEEQRKIISILDRIDFLCNDLTEGLPAEIEARQKQYEYYRDKLLTFKELV